MVRFNNYFGLAVAVLVARDDPLYGPFERGRQKLSFLVCYRPLAKARRSSAEWVSTSTAILVLSEIDNESVASSLEQSCKEQSLQQ